MDEGEVRQLAQMYAIVAEIEALKTRRAGMLADNSYRESCEIPLNYSADSFFEVEEEFNVLSKRLKDEI